MARSSSKKKAPALPGENPTQNFRVNVNLLGTAYVLNRNTPSYMPNTERELLNWAAQYASTARALRLTFPEVFNAGDIYNVSVVEDLLARISDSLVSLGIVPGIIRGLTAYKNVLIYNRDHGSVPPPPAENARIPNLNSKHSGLVGIIDAQVRLLRGQPNFNESFARQLGILPTEGPTVDPATYDPQARGQFMGGAVLITARSPQGLRGVSLLEIRVDRNDGNGIVPAGATASSRFTDHHDLPARATHWIYYVGYLDRMGLPVGIQNTCDVVVQPRA